MIQGTKYLCDGEVLFDEVSAALEWAAVSSGQRFVAYKAEDKIKLYAMFNGSLRNPTPFLFQHVGRTGPSRPPG